MARTSLGPWTLVLGIGRDNSSNQGVNHNVRSGGKWRFYTRYVCQMLYLFYSPLSLSLSHTHIDSSFGL